MSPILESAARAAETPFRPLLAAVTVDLDRSVLLQMALFSVLIVLLKPLLFDPMLRVFALREERTEGARTEARGMQERAADILANYEKELAKIRVVAAEERDKVRLETAKLETQILEEANQASARILEDGRRQIAAELQSIREKLAQRSTELAQDIGSQVMGREVNR
jgi:F-type H+-transporting ATPase subunit b